MRATVVIVPALSAASCAWRRARRTSVSMNTPATTSVATVVSQRASGDPRARVRESGPSGAGAVMGTPSAPARGGLGRA